MSRRNNKAGKKDVQDKAIDESIPTPSTSSSPSTSGSLFTSSSSSSSPSSSSSLTNDPIKPWSANVTGQSPLSNSSSSISSSPSSSVSSSSTTSFTRPPLNTAGPDPAPSSVQPTTLQTITPIVIQTQDNDKQTNITTTRSSSSSSPSTSSSSSSSSSSAKPSSASSSAASSAVAPSLPHWFQIFYAIIKDTDGRDKALKALQYGLRYIKWLMQQSPPVTYNVLQACLMLSSPPIFTTSPSSSSSSSSSGALQPSSLSTKLPPSPVTLLHNAIMERLDLLSSSFSAARKVIRLFKWCYTIPIAFKNYQKWKKEYQILESYYRQQQLNNKSSSYSYPFISTSSPYTSIYLPFLFPTPLPLFSTIEFCNNILAILTDMSDDVDWYSKHRLLPSHWNPRAVRSTIVLWFFNVIIDLSLSTRNLLLIYTDLIQQKNKLRDIQQQISQIIDQRNVINDVSSSQYNRLLQQQREMKQQVADVEESLYNTQLSWLKFAADFGVALPSYYNQQHAREGLVQFSGCMSAIVATYKLILAVK